MLERIRLRQTELNFKTGLLWTPSSDRAERLTNENVGIKLLFQVCCTASKTGAFKIQVFWETLVCPRKKKRGKKKYSSKSVK